MRPSLLQMIQLPALGTAAAPALIIQAGTEPMRVMVRNGGGNLVYIAHESNALQQIGSTAGVYQLPSGQVDIFVLAPGQTLVGAASGGGGEISIAASEAVPINKHWMES